MPVTLTVSVSPRSWSVMVMVPLTVRDVLRRAVAGNLGDGGRVGRAVDDRHVVGAGDGDHQVLGVDIAVAVIDLGHVGERQRVACAQPVEVGRRRVVVPVDRLLLAVGGERIEADGADWQSAPRR